MGIIFQQSLRLVFLLVLFLAGGVSASQNTDPFFKADTLRVLIFSGRNNHDWRATTPVLKKTLLKSGRFDVRVTEEVAGVTAETLAPYDLIVLNYCGPRWGQATEKAVAAFVRLGKGLVVVHGASYAFTGLEVLGDRHKRLGIREPPWVEYLEMIGGYWSEEMPKTGHGRMHTFSVKMVDRSHPITQGLGETFLTSDELYHRMRMSPKANVLATAYDDPRFRGTGKAEPVLWTVRYGKGRVFHTVLGHDLAAMQEVGFVTTFLRGAEWAAAGAVTLPVAVGRKEQDSKPLRLLVVTGGHSYPTSFYTLFEGWAGMEWTHAVSNHEAFRSDLREKFDALVLHDMSQEISDAEKKNLVEYLESGKGMVVLHHAIADYQDWPWWWRQVVGGKYLLKADGDLPGSTYKHDQEFSILPAAPHPITAPLGRLHVWDETYKGLWISPDVKVLLETDHPLNDRPVAWISPYKKSRVLYIQLGHGREAHLHDGYRTLVRRAVLWSAGRLLP